MSGLSPQQIAIRKGLIGSSEIGAILDFYAEPGSPRCDPYKTAQKVFNDKDLPAEPNEKEKDHQMWGLDQEPGILRFHARKHGLRLLDPAEVKLEAEPGSGKWKTLVHPSHPLCATPDGIGAGTGFYRDIQAKNAQRFQTHRWGEPGTDDAPLVYVAQLQIELGVMLATPELQGAVATTGDLAVCLEGAPPLAYHVAFDVEMFEGLTHLAAKFKRDHLDTRKPPRIDGSDEAADYVKRRWQKHCGLMQPWTPDAQALVDIARHHAETEKVAETLKEGARNQLKNLIGEAAGIEGLCTWKRCKDTVKTITDWEAVAKELAELAAKGAPAGGLLAEIAAKHTGSRVTKQGHRTLRLMKATGESEIEEAA